MQHPDEGTIHAWLDEQLPRDEAAAIEAHVADCRPCADAVAEARGLIAASSRILMALDGVPRGVMPKQPMPAGDVAQRAPEPVAIESAPNAVIDLAARAAAAPGSTTRRAPRRWLSGPSLAAAAAVVVAVGSFAVVRNKGADSSMIAGEDARVSGPSVYATPPSAPSSAASGAAAPLPAGAVGNVPSAPPPALGSARAATEAAADRVERSESRQAEAPPAARSFTPTAQRSVPPVEATLRDEAKVENELTRVAKQRVSSVDSARQALAALAPLRDSMALKKAETTTVAIIQGRAAVADGARNVPTPAPSAPAASPRIAIRGANSIATTPAATGVIGGRVTDGNGTGLSGAFVRVDSSSTGTTTGASGEFRLAGVPAGSVTLRTLRIGYEENRQAVTVVAGETVAADVIMKPAQVSLSEVVVTGTASGSSRRAPRPSDARAPARQDSEPGAAMPASGSRAIGCYELGITATAATANRSRTVLSQVPRRIALDAEIVPANADGIWYRARDLSSSSAVPNGLWRPVGTDGVEIEWLFGSKLARIRLTGPAQGMMRGTIDEMDRSAGTTESGNVVSSRRACR